MTSRANSMEHNLAVSKRIREVLDSFAQSAQPLNVFGQVGLPRDLRSPLRLYRLQRPVVEGRPHATVFVIPTKPKVSKDDFDAVATFLDSDDSAQRDTRLAFVDCFSLSPSVIPDGWMNLPPRKLWQSLMSFEPTIGDVSEKEDLDEVMDHFIQRKLVALRRMDNGDMQLDTESREALDFLGEWVKESPFTSRSLLLFGERGSGKTWLLKRFWSEQNRRNNVDPWLHPPAIYINLEQYGVYLLRVQGIAKTLAYFA